MYHCSYESVFDATEIFFISVHMLFPTFVACAHVSMMTFLLAVNSYVLWTTFCAFFKTTI
ncbi:putative integral membrane protein [Babesia bovis T2Bo]|nr:putative integral membrane protein [Babesia bovis T2Bo]KAG6440117.1 putative integral membrane protein [Babesia bovis T2Bo]